MDDSEPAWSALRYGLSTFPDASFTVLHVHDFANYHTYGGSMGVAFADGELIERHRREQASALFAEVVELAESDDREIDTETETGSPATVIVSYAEKQGVDWIVIGSHGRTGLRRLLQGSVAEAVIRRSPVPVTVVREF